MGATNATIPIIFVFNVTRGSTYAWCLVHHTMGVFARIGGGEGDQRDGSSIAVQGLGNIYSNLD